MQKVDHQVGQRLTKSLCPNTLEYKKAVLSQKMTERCAQTALYMSAPKIVGL